MHSVSFLCSQGFVPGWTDSCSQGFVPGWTDSFSQGFVPGWTDSCSIRAASTSVLAESILPQAGDYRENTKYFLESLPYYYLIISQKR